MPEVVDILRWELVRDDASERTYDITFLVKAEHTDAPDRILLANGLPRYGDTWAFGNGNDPWATCQWDATVRHHEGSDQNATSAWWQISQKFSTAASDRDSGNEGGNPLTEPLTISGSFLQEPKEMWMDRHGNPLLNSALQPIRGALVTRNVAKPTIQISGNIADLPLGWIRTALNRVNQVAMWGLPPRHIRLEGAPWTRKIKGRDFVYYTIAYEFLCDFDGFDRLIADRGTRKLIDGGDRTNPAHFEMIKNAKEEKEADPVFLDGLGNLLAPGAPIVETKPELDKEFNFFMFGLPQRL
jgi:hypothetical protein